MTIQQTWRDIWRNRVDNLDDRPTLETLLIADGFDFGLGHIATEHWNLYVNKWANRLSIGPGTRVYEIGCGSGAFLEPLARRGALVGGLDFSDRLISLARRAIPSGDFSVRDATAFAGQYDFDIVLSHSVFQYFPDHDYADTVLHAMAKAATRAVAIFDVPDRTKREASTNARAEAFGDIHAYRQHYRGLTHLDFVHTWFTDRLVTDGFATISLEQQDIEGYGNSSFRYNVWAFRTTP